MEIQTNDRLRGESEDAAVKSVVDRARIEGPDVYLEVLNDRIVWNETSVVVQDLAIQEVARRLSPEFNFVETDVYCCGGQTHRIATFVHLKTEITINLLPGGTYLRGSELGDEEEIPVKEVVIQPFLIGQTLVTQHSWDKIGGKDRRFWPDPDLPINRVSWHDCHEWLSAAGDELRLPSESEWEFACRAGTQTLYSFGDNPAEIANYAWIRGYSQKRPHPPKQKKCNSFGLFDMHGNLWEWCEDSFEETYENVGTNHVPHRSDSALRPCRGGSWYNPVHHATSTTRDGSESTDYGRSLGFRIARSIN